LVRGTGVAFRGMRRFSIPTPVIGTPATRT
jgi:hypothetical protein